MTLTRLLRKQLMVDTSLMDLFFFRCAEPGQL